MILGTQLPEGDLDAARERLLRRFPDAQEHAPAGPIAEAIASIRALLAGEWRDLAGLPIALDGAAPFPRSVYRITLTIPPGQTLTYGEIAQRLGELGAARAVGVALGQNPWPIIVPCHRVLAAGGRTGGFSAAGGVTTKLRLLTIERARTSGEASLFDPLPFQAKGN